MALFAKKPLKNTVETSSHATPRWEDDPNVIKLAGTKTYVKLSPVQEMVETIIIVRENSTSQNSTLLLEIES